MSTWWLWIGGLVLLAAGGFGIYRALQNPVFFAGLVKIFIDALLPDILKAIKPKNLTNDQREKIRQAIDPFDKRPSGGHGKGG